jgi:hypothetical protein
MEKTRERRWQGGGGGMFMSFECKLVSHTLKENGKREKKKKKKREKKIRGWERKEID